MYWKSDLWFIFSFNVTPFLANEYIPTSRSVCIGYVPFRAEYADNMSPSTRAKLDIKAFRKACDLHNQRHAVSIISINYMGIMGLQDAQEQGGGHRGAKETASWRQDQSPH